MRITPIGININRETIINDFYKNYQDRKNAKICNETNFETGYISYEDGVFLPNGTYVLIVENGKKDKLGRIFHFEHPFVSIKSTQTEGTAIVDIFYDINSSKKRSEMNNSLIVDYIYKNTLLNKHNKDKYLQVVSCDITEDDKWSFVKVEYGNPDTKMFYTYGWKYYDDNIYEKKDILSNKLFCFQNINKAIFIKEEEYSIDKKTNIEYKIKPNVNVVPDEIEISSIYIMFLGISFIFKVRWILWIIFTILYIIKRKDLRNKYNG